MAGLLVALAVMAVLMSAALPAWRHQAKREKEAELIFRGEQYVRAISLWERKMGPGSRPPNFDILVEQRFLRKKYKDPMSPDGEFLPVFAGTNMPGVTPVGRGGSRGRGGARGAPPREVEIGPEGPGGPGAPGGGPGGPGGVGGSEGLNVGSTGPGGSPGFGASSRPGGQIGGGGIFGVMSKSKEMSIRLYQGRNHYNEWRFVHSGASNAPGGVGGSAMPGGGGRANRPGPGQRGGPRGRGPAGIGPGSGPGGRGPGGMGPGSPTGPGSGPPPGGQGPGPGPGGSPPTGPGGRGPGF
jgi:hypothetical protein